MFDKRLQEIKLELNTLALENDLNYEQMIKYLHGFSLRPKKLHSFSTQIWNSLNSLEGTRKPHKKSSTIVSIFGKQNVENGVISISDFSNSSIGETENGMEYVHQCLEDSLIEMNRVDHTIMENILEIVVTGKVYKIRQTFRDLMLNMLSLSGLSFYVYYESGRIEFQDFSSNFITEILQSDIKCKLLQKIVKSAENTHFLELSENSDYMRLFEIDPVKTEKGEYFGTTLKWVSEEEESLIICIAIQTSLNTQISEVQDFLSPKLLRKVTQISLIQTSENISSVISKNYSKKMLDLLQIMINSCEVRLKRKLCQFCDIKVDNCFSVSNLIRIAGNKLKEVVQNEHLNHTIKRLTDKFEETQYQLIEEIRMYKKYVSEDCQILMEFNKNGKLVFCSNQRDNPILNDLNAIWEPEKHILFTLFENNPRIQNQYKRALKGYRTDRFFEVTRDIKARIIQNKNKIDKIHVIIEDSDASSTSFLGSKDSETRKQRKYRIRQREECTTIKALEQEHPGIAEQGWLNLFVKDLKRNERSHSGEKKKHPTFINQEQKNFLLMHRSFSSEVDLKGNLLECLRQKQYQKLDLNLLTYQEQDLDVFALGLLNQLEYFQNLNTDPDKVQNFISDLHDLYEINNNPFHNFHHGVNVMHTCYLISALPENNEIMNSSTIFAIVFSGLCHDVGHTGFTNDFQIASHSKKALLYNDKSPLQNFHASTTFELLRKPQNNFLEELSREDFKQLRIRVIENILYTDIKQHFPLLKKFEETVKTKKKLTKEDSSLLSCMIVHSSDFGGSIKNFDVCKEWSFRVNKEFHRQYKEQGRLGLPQTPFMKDLDKPSVLSKGECGFLKVIVFPLYQALKKLYLTNELIHKLNRNIEANIKEWQYIHFSETEKERQQAEIEKQNKQTRQHSKE